MVMSPAGRIVLLDRVAMNYQPAVREDMKVQIKEGDYPGNHQSRRDETDKYLPQ